MCGIFGQISINRKIKTKKKDFLQCLSYLSHRGPDDTGYFINSKIAFGHKRLSILDLSKNGKQPMMLNNGKFVLIYNGEIYNFKELKSELIKKGYKFKSMTDTEVLLYGLIDQGPRFIEKCNGMFAFAFYNNEKKTGYIFRDRIGIKPLFYSLYKGKLTFSSNIKSIHSYNKIKKTINLQSVSSFLSFRQPIKNETLFNNIFSLEPGSFIEIKNKKIKIKRYWKLEKFFKRNKIDKGEKFYVKRINELLKSSIKFRLISDVKVASLLSGGLDSTIISSIINEIIGKNFLAYSIGYTNKGYNEFTYSKLVSKKLNMKHKVFSSEPELYFKDMKKLIKLRDQPLTIPNEVTQFQLCREIKKKATVVLSGCGADELFCGYGRIFSSVEDYKRIKDINKISEEQKAIFLDNVKSRYGKINFKNNLDHFLSIYPYTKNNLKEKLLSEKFNHKKINMNIKNYFKSIFSKIKTDNYSDKMQFFFQKFHLTGILEREDISSMAASVELRVPFLDHRIVEFAASLPLKYKIKTIKNDLSLTSDKTSEINDISKYILRKTYKDKIPKEILQRKKVGFPVPLHDWMKKKHIRKIIFSTLLSKKCKRRGIFNHDFIKKQLNNNKISKFVGDSRIYQDSIAAKLWMCFNLEIFFKNHD
tara:strand:- start:2494 stop:4428 length:1935 start_codon:yes stop_codon:yes gene_type:complete